MNNCVATVLMCTYNAERFIKEQLDSLLNQTYEHVEIIIYDDLSEDETVSIISSIIDNNQTSKTIYLHINQHRSGGPCQNFKNIIMDNLHKDYVFFCDQDDIWDVNKIQEMMEYMVALEKKELKPYLIGHSSAIVDENGNIYDHKRIKDISFYNTIFSPTIQGCCMMVNRAVFEKGRISSAYMAMHDWYLTLVAGLTGEVYIIDKEFVQYRQHNNNQIGYKRETVLERIELALDFSGKLIKFEDIVMQLKSVCEISDTDFSKLYLNLWSRNKAWCLIKLLKQYDAIQSDLHGGYQMFMTYIALKRLFMKEGKKR